MSPTAFKQQVTGLLSDFAKCQQFCENIRTNRRIGTTHEALDGLQFALKESTYQIQGAYGSLRQTFGSRIELGDETSRTSLSRAIQAVRSNVEPRLSDIAHRRHGSRDPQLPGFRDLSSKLATVERVVLDAFEGLARRFENTKVEAPRPTVAKQSTRPNVKTDEVTVSLKELDILIKHMKSSWVETKASGRTLYVNAFDDKRTQWEKPDGFLRRAPHPTTTQGNRRNLRRQSMRDDYYSSSEGW